MARSTSLFASSAAEPEDEPPAEYPSLRGLITGAGLEVWLPPDRQKYSQVALPSIVTPSSRIRVTMLASTSGTKPYKVDAPFIIGTPATITLSFIARVLLDSFPSERPVISDFQYHALCGLSSGLGR